MITVFFPSWWTFKTAAQWALEREKLAINADSLARRKCENGELNEKYGIVFRWRLVLEVYQ